MLRRWLALTVAVSFTLYTFPQKALASSSGGSSANSSAQLQQISEAAGAVQSFQTDLFTGRAQTSVPIVVPPGRKNIQPNLNLNYSSSGGNGWLGVGWALDMVGNHTLLARVLLTGWGNMFDAGYFWHFNELWIGGAAGPGEKGWEIGLIFTVFTMRIAAAIGFLQMKRWGQQWMIVTCWMGVVIWCGYVFNMTMYADVRYAGVVLPVIGWWLYDIFYITPFLAIPYLHTVNREIFTD